MRIICSGLFLSGLVMLFGIASAIPAPLGANFTANITSGIAPLNVNFTDETTGNPAGWAWYFGDENFAAPWTQQTPTAAWSGRGGPTSSVALANGNIVLMGGTLTSDVWQSTDDGAIWTPITANAEWSARSGHSSVVMPDGSIVLMGGFGSGTGAKNDVWRSEDGGATWTQMTASATWPARSGHSSVVMPDGTIVLMGGVGGNTLYLNDVWRSTDYGATWTQMTANATWTARFGQTCVAMADGSIVLMGGITLSGDNKKDVWRSTDEGATWTQITANAGWLGRWGLSSVVMPDGSIVLMGGVQDSVDKNDVWRSTDYGATWTEVNSSAGWSGRGTFNSVVVPDGSIVLMGGISNVGTEVTNDVWRFIPAGSSAQNPVHSYTSPGNYTVTMQAYDAFGYNSTRKTGYITVAPNSTYLSHIGVFRNTSGNWYLDTTYTGVVNKSFHFGTAGDIPIMGDWNGTGIMNIGVFRPSNGNWYLDTTYTGVVNKSFNFGTTGDIPVVGDWDRSGISNGGFFRPSDGNWYLYNKIFGIVAVIKFQYGTSGDIPVIGDWDGDGVSDMGVFRPSKGNWYLMTFGRGVQKIFHFGTPGDIPIVGDWNNDGITDVGVFRPSNGNWYLDTTKTGIVNKTFHFGTFGDIPVVGDWDGNGISDIGVFRPANGNWYLDTTKLGVVNKIFHFGTNGDTPIVGKWI